MNETPALFRRFPELRDRIPHVPLARHGTPLEEIELETPAGRRTILVKRDDLTGEPYGGNKVRKLEFILSAARRRGSTRLVTAGAAGSHHALATALYGRVLGFEVSLVLFPQSLNDHVRQVLLMDHGAGAELRFVRRMEMVPLGIAAARMRHYRDRPYVVAPGGSDPIGTLGYVSAGIELAEQLAELGDPVPTGVHVAAGTLGTAAGLALGLALAGFEIPVRATRITSRIVTNETVLHNLVEGASAILRDAGVHPPDVDYVSARVDLRHGHIGAGYGRETDAGREATRIFAQAGLRLDPTYTSKAAADLLDSPASGPPPVYVHTLSATEPLELARQTDPATLPPAFRRYLGV